MRSLRLPSDSVAQPALMLPVLTGIAATAALWLRQRRLTTRVERLGGAALETLLGAIDANDPVTGAHVRRVARYALVLADAAGLDEHECHSVERVALFHDIGKIHEALFDVIHDDHALTPDERRAIRTHPRRGAEVLEPLAAFYPDLTIGVLAHHERWNGSGYPKRLRGMQIPLTARIVAIADTFDAVTHSRRYRRGRSIEKGQDVIGEGRGTEFDPELVDLFLSPPVQERVEAEMRRASAIERGRVSHRAKHGEHVTAPDVSFRWRATTPAEARDLR
jgi:HD-GYP domain-containing protein (c-di-GMP phosphodiesterase class II)